ncbi:MAG: HAMP domain-containing histidine kinase [Gemmatimonadetes bacterium]|nr:HAMP domain-containing histidine kinase [Gemmatimonadota bacterium]
MTAVADNALPRPGQSSDDSSAFEDASGKPALDDAINALPERFRAPGRRLAADLPRWSGPRPGSAAEPSGLSPWHEGLEPEEAWAVAETFRRHLESTAADELHGALDQALLGVALATESRTAAAHRRMLEDVSHDLRSPLNSILFLADALQGERSGPLNDVQARQLGILYTAAVTLVGLVNDLIDFARLDSRERIRVAAVSFSLESVVRDVEGLLGPIVALRDVSLGFDIETEGLRTGDPQLLSRVLLNLVSNAVQAVDQGGRVAVRADEIERGELRIEISDDRAETDEARLRSLIDSAAEGRLPGETRGWTHGLGLTICARLVKAAGGRLKIARRRSEGTAFIVELPFRRL